ncbi:MAG: ComF family protein [Planctomycetota bacterium]
MGRFPDELFAALWPLRCALCGGGSENGLACPAHALPEAPAGPRCGRCADLLSAALPDGELCAACRRAPPGYRRLVTLADYRRQPAVVEWILAFKHGGRADLAGPLGWALARRFLRAAGPAAGRRLLVPVPLHPLRRAERGYDQARLLAQEVAVHTTIPWRAALRRRRWTPPQGSPGVPSRSANVRNAFVPVPRAAADAWGAEVWLVDDVLSSGATASECARVLRGAGARAVCALTLARPS